MGPSLALRAKACKPCSSVKARCSIHIERKSTALAVRVGLPAIYGFREFAEAGGLMSYGANLPAVYRRAGRIG